MTQPNYSSVSFTAISKFIVINATKDSALHNAVAQIASVHTVDAVDDVPALQFFFGALTGDNTGQSGYCCDDIACEAAISPNVPNPDYQGVHELGHFVYERFLGGDAVQMGQNLSGVCEAIEASERVTSLRDGLQKLFGKIEEIKASPGEILKVISHVTDLLHPAELFAYAYAQYITEKCNDKTLKQQLQALPKRSQGNSFPRAWDEDDFQQISAEMDKVLLVRGWIVNVSNDDGNESEFNLP